MTDRIPPEVWEAAKRRSEAREARDWATADELRAEIEGAGWTVVDSGTSFRLEAIAADVEVGGEIRYGSSEAVPSRLADPPTGIASVVMIATADAIETLQAVDALASAAPNRVDIVLVADGLPDRSLEGLRSADLANRTGAPVELVRTSVVLGRGAAVNVGVRRSRAAVVVLTDPSIVAAGDIVSPLVRALEDPTVAVAGPFGLVSSDMRRFDEVGEGPADATAILGPAMAFRRADAAARGPLDEAFRFYRHLDVWWSLVLRDEGEGITPRRAVVVPGLPLRGREPRDWSATPPTERDRLSKRNFYRVLDRFRSRLDLAVPDTMRHESAGGSLTRRIHPRS